MAQEGLPQIGWAKGSFPPRLGRSWLALRDPAVGHHQSFSSMVTNFRNGSRYALARCTRKDS